MKYSAKDEQQLMNTILDPAIAEDFEQFVMFMYPWGKKGTPLEHHKGPRGWQREACQEITLHIKENKNSIVQHNNPIILQDATSSGRGIGKSAFVAWLNHWNASCHLGATGITTANTEAQLRSRTWAELGKWITLALNGHWFDMTATTLRPAPWFDELCRDELQIDTKYYYAQAQIWSEENPDAFAGVHNHNGILLIFDEASGIPQPIWTVSEGFFTEPILHRYWFVFSNPRRNSGPFYECFHKNRNFWKTHYIDSRTVEGTDLAIYDKIIEQHGEDSDAARVEVKGQFPRQGANQFISTEAAYDAQSRELPFDNYAPLIMGVDIARFGDDSTVIRFRQGRDARSIKPVVIKGLDNMQVAYRVAELIDKHNPDAVNIDAGNGSGVIDRLRELGYRVNEIWFGSKTTAQCEYYNRRTQMWGDMRAWLPGGCIDDLQELFDDLTGPEYKYAGRDGDKLILESKEEMKKRGQASPDHGDALALTFAVNVARKNLTVSNSRIRNKVAKGLDYDIFG